jgi:hypothetical protein
MSNPKESCTKLDDADYRLARAYRLIEEIARRVRAEEKQKNAMADAHQESNADGLVLEDKIAHCESENFGEHSERGGAMEGGV